MAGKVAAIVALALIVVSCGDSPTAPSSQNPIASVPPAVVGPQTLTGQLRATNGGQPIGGISVNGSITDTIGSFVVPFTNRLVFSGNGIVERGVFTTTNRANVDAIVIGASFSLDYYRAFARNGFDAPGVLQPIRRWMQTPRIYLKTVDEAGEAIHGPTLDVIENTIRDAIPLWTGNILGPPTIERGTGTMVGVSGWITVRFPTIQAGYCGLAQIGQDGGWIELSYHVTPGIQCRSSSSIIAPRTIRHEIGHALGFYHPNRNSDLMSAGNWTDPNQQMNAVELAHAAIVYRRPIGNVDPDSDSAATPTTHALVMK